MRIIVLTAVVLAFVATSAVSARELRTERVKFKRGTNSATVESSIAGYEAVDYVLRARKGQTMNVSLATKHGATYFNVLPPGEDNVAMYIGSTSGNQFEKVLPTTGDYKIRVYMMRSAARRSEVAKYRLEMIIGGGT